MKFLSVEFTNVVKHHGCAHHAGVQQCGSCVATAVMQAGRNTGKERMAQVRHDSSGPQAPAHVPISQPMLMHPGCSPPGSS
jgi:hypothetical protein